MDNKNKVEGKNSGELFKVQGDWNKQSNALKSKYPKLTSEDLKFEAGKESDLLQRMETRLQKNRHEVVNILKDNQKVNA
ncbi:hypothetical protein V8G61_14545 [Gaetbulibacter sp. M240]|uniref:hypothetical protein n=1 Tax=Gaetbulibacter sp. M240 TaxID=3126511 RepID=UPI00374E507D